MKVIKRDGRAVEYNSDKICVAIEKANKEVIEEKRATKEEIKKIINYIESLDKKRILVEDVQDIIEQKLMELGKYELAKKYIVYRYNRALVRKQSTTDESILGLIKNINNNIVSNEENFVIAPVQRNLIAGEVSKDLTKRILLPEKIAKANEDGILHFHATEYFLQPIINSSLINIGDMLDNGTIINKHQISQPENFQSACIIFSQIIACVASSQYGEQYINIKHLGKYLRKSYESIIEELSQIKEEKQREILIEKMTKKELFEGIKIINSQIDMLVTIYGKSPIVFLILELDDEDEYYEENLMIITELLNQKTMAIFESDNKYFSNIICDFKVKDNEIFEKLCELAQKCKADINSPKIKKYQYEGHFNQGRVSINLPQIAKISEKNEKDFWKLLEERLEICYEALMCRHYALLGTNSDVSPIHWQNGAIARLKKGEKIDKLLKDGYSDISLGYVGIDETVKMMLEDSEDELELNKLKNKLIKYLEEKVQSWKKMTGLGFVLYEDIDNEAFYRINEINLRK